MLSAACYLIVVGATEKSFNHKLLWTIPIPEFMDSEEKEICSDDGCKTESYNEPHITILKSSATNNVLPSVHSAVAASPLFSSYRSVFQNWKHSVPKLYKYPSSDIEVVVYRKNGEVETISNQKSSKTQKSRKGDTDEKASIDSSSGAETVDDISKETSTEEVVMSARLEEAPFLTSNDKEEFADASSTIEDERATTSNELNSVPLGTEAPSVFQSSSHHDSQLKSKCIDDSFAAKIGDLRKNDVESSCVKLHVPPQKDCLHSDENLPKCEFIFNIKPRLSSVPSLERRSQGDEQKSFAPTMAVSTLIRTEDKATQISPFEIIAVTRRDAASQCDCDEVMFGTNSTQTDAQYQVNILKLDFSQIFPTASEAATQADKLEETMTLAATQTDKLETIASVVTQTNKLEGTTSTVTQTDKLETLTSAFTQTNKLEGTTSTVTQTESQEAMASAVVQTENRQSEAQEPPTVQQQLLQTVEWHTNVPCCNASHQIDPYILNLNKESFCQAVPEAESKSTQIEESDIASVNNDATTNTEFITRNAEVQLSASCCYFTKKRERRKYEMKLDAIRQEIRNFYKYKQHYLTQQQQTADMERTGCVDSNKSEGLNCSSGSEYSKCMESNDEAEVSGGKSLEEETKYLDELGHEVDKLLGNTSLLKSNLESLEDTSYYEDDWLVDNN